jgi:hypothetical protein
VNTRKILVGGILATAAIGGSIAIASSANAAAPAANLDSSLDTPAYVDYAANCTSGVTTHTDYKWVPNVGSTGPTMWTVDDAAANTPATFTWKNAQVAYHRDGTKTQQATDTQCGVRITSQSQLDQLVAQGNGTINENIDVPASVTQADNLWLGWTHVTGNVTIEGDLQMTADIVDGNVTVSGPGSQLWLANYASHIKGNLTVHDSSGAWNGSAGTSFGDNTGYTGPDAATADGTSQIDGNFSFLNNTGWLYVGSPLHVGGSFTASGNAAYPAHFDYNGLTASGGTFIS